MQQTASDLLDRLVRHIDAGPALGLHQTLRVSEFGLDGRIRSVAAIRRAEVLEPHFAQKAQPAGIQSFTAKQLHEGQRLEDPAPGQTNRSLRKAASSRSPNAQQQG